MVDRLRCCVPFCRRTRGDRKNDPVTEEMEWICHEHWAVIPLRRRRVWYRLHRLWLKDDGMTLEAIWNHPKWGKRAIYRAALDRIWAHLKREAIERALGVG